MDKYMLFWLPMPVLGVLNGAFREMVLRKRLGELAAHQVSTLTLILLILLYSLAIKDNLQLGNASDAVVCGFTWVAMTLFFEFGFGYWFAKKTFRELLNDYNLMLGRMWLLVPVFLSILPTLLRKW